MFNLDFRIVLVTSDSKTIALNTVVAFSDKNGL